MTGKTAVTTSPAGHNGVPVLNAGYGFAHAHHGELFQGQIQNRAGVHRRCLLSLPCKKLYSKAIFHPDSTGRVKVYPAEKEKSRRAAELALAFLRFPFLGGIANIENSMPEGKGYGSSTADCVATVIAVSDAVNRPIKEEDVARIVVKAETASDNTMFSRAVLFAHREGEIIEDYLCPLPQLEVVGIDTDANATLNTLEHEAAEYSWQELRTFEVLTNALRRALRCGELDLLGQVATTSALMNERFLHKPLICEIRALAASVETLGIAAAHSGTILSILLDPGDSRLEHKISSLEKGLQSLGITQVLRFNTRENSTRKGA